MIARASQWTAAEVASATSGTLLGVTGRPMVGVATDTRDALAEHLFVALHGERFDGHDFLDLALQKGAAGLLVEAQKLKARPELAALSLRAPLIAVEDTLFALGDLALAHRKKAGARTYVAALTGSNGKTTTKEMIAALFGAACLTLKTEGNLNNLIGLPLTLLGLLPEQRAAVLEMGMSSRGEIARLTQIAAPDLGLVLNVGPAHIGRLGSLAQVAAAKGELFSGLSASATAVFNRDDPEVVRELGKTAAVRRIGFGSHEGAEVRLIERQPFEEGQKILLSVSGQKIGFDIPHPGRHNAENATAAVAVAFASGLFPSGLEPKMLSAAFAGAARISGRLVLRSIGPYSVVDDSYNANAASMLAAIEAMSARAKQRGVRLCALLGEMRELGTFSEAEHLRVGAALATHGGVLCGAFGPEAGPIAQGAKAGGVVARHEASDADALFTWFTERLRPNDLILVKGSRGIHMELFISKIEKEHG